MAWEAALGSYVQESFDDVTLNPGITATAGDAGGAVTEGGRPYYQTSWDIVDTERLRESVLGFDSDVCAWGGTFDLVGSGGRASESMSIWTASL